MSHAPKSPSAAHRLHGCSGALAYVASLPEDLRQEAGQAAREGTAAHKVLERCLAMSSPPSAYVGTNVLLIGDDEDAVFEREHPQPHKDVRSIIPVTEKMAEDVGIALDYVRSRVDGNPDVTMLLETRTNPLPDRDDTSGTADVTIITDTLLEVVDYKNGRVAVGHKRNPQLLAYLAGRAEDFEWAFQEYRITVVQPNAFHEDGRVRSYDVTKDELRAFQALHRKACERADEAAEAFKDSEFMTQADGQCADSFWFKAWTTAWLYAGDHCAFCEAGPVCPTRRAKVEEVTRSRFDELPDEIEVPMNDLANVLRWKPFIESFLEDIEKRALALHAKGESVPGVKMVRKQSKRRWRKGLKPEEIVVAMIDKGYVGQNSQSQLWSPASLITGPQAEKLVPADKRKEFAKDFLEKPEGGLTPAPEDDPRPAAVIASGNRLDSIDD